MPNSGTTNSINNFSSDQKDEKTPPTKRASEDQKMMKAHQEMARKSNRATVVLLASGKQETKRAARVKAWNFARLDTDHSHRRQSRKRPALLVIEEDLQNQPEELEVSNSQPNSTAAKRACLTTDPASPIAAVTVASTSSAEPVNLAAIGLIEIDDQSSTRENSVEPLEQFVLTAPNLIDLPNIDQHINQEAAPSTAQETTEIAGNSQSDASAEIISRNDTSEQMQVSFVPQFNYKQVIRELRRPGQLTMPKKVHHTMHTVLNAYEDPLKDSTVIIASKSLKGAPFGNVTLAMLDVARLSRNPIRWLNDNLTTYCLEKAAHEYLPKNLKVDCDFSNTYFFTRLVQYKEGDNIMDIAASNGTMSNEHEAILLKNCARALKLERKNNYWKMFSKDVLYIPVLYGNHWTTALVLNLSAAICDRDTLNEGPPCTILFCNSYLEYTSSHVSVVSMVLKTFFKKVFEKHNDKGNKYFDEYRIVTREPEGLPQQTNGSDCGLFLISFSSSMFCSFDKIYEMYQSGQEIAWEDIRNEKVPPITENIRKDTFLRIMKDANREKREHVNKYNLGLPTLSQENEIEDEEVKDEGEEY